MSVRFTQSCPTCGRRVQIRASLVGYTVACQHCNAEFTASADGHQNENTRVDAPASPASESLMDRVERALKRASDHSIGV